MPPRGGARGGFGAGRPRPAAGKVRIGGIDIEVDEDIQNTGEDNSNQPSETFPPYQVSIARPLTETERVEIARYRSIRDRIHKGPLYTTFDDEPPRKPQGRKRKNMDDTFDAFNGMETYSMKYTTTQRRTPQLASRPFVLHFFPAELHATLDPTTVLSRGNVPKKKRKQLQTDFHLDDLDADAVAESKDVDDEDAANRPPPEDGDEPPDEVVDDDFDEEDDDEGDDYNAERYFDDGEAEEDVGDGDDGGGGGDDF